MKYQKESEFVLVSYYDLNCVEDYINRKPMLGLIFILNEGSITYVSKKQVIVALSSTKTKYVVFSLAMHKGI